MILVTGASGVIGSAVTTALLARGAQVRVFVRDAAKVAHLPSSVERVVGSFERMDQVHAAMSGSERMFLLSPEITGTHFASLIASARAHGVRHAVKLSTLEAGRATDGLARWHRAEELQLEASGLELTFVRPGNFASNALEWAGSIRSEGKVFAPTGHGKSAPIDPRDIADVCALALTETGHTGQVYHLTGPEALSVPEQTAILSRLLHKPLQFVDVEPEQMGDQLRAYHLPEALVSALVELWTWVRRDESPVVTETVRELLGRPAHTFEQWARAHLSAFA